MALKMPPNPPPKAYTVITSAQVGGSICDYCLQPPKTKASSNPSAALSWCTGCRRTGYCNTICQKKDWKVHKLICARFKLMNDWDQKYGDKKLTVEGYNTVQNLRMATFAEMTPENPYGSFFIAYITDQVKCSVCFRTPFQLPKFHRFSSCERCHLSWWCSPECQNDFAKYHPRNDCNERLDVACAERFRTDYAVNRRSRRQYPANTSEKHSTYIPLLSLKNWQDYYDTLYPNWEFNCSIASGEFAEGNPDPARALRLLTTESIVYPLTILAALEHAYANITRHKRLDIHVVGAAARESSGQGMTEEILHCLPKLEELHFWLVGPQAKEIQGIEGGNFACDTCKPAGFARYTNYYAGDYQTFMTTGPGATNPNPNLVVGLNTGMAEVHTEHWKLAFDIILAKNIPAVFTAYSREEARLEEAMWRNMRARFMKNVEKNKWKGVIPIINNYMPREEGHCASSYNSYYWYMIQGRTT